MKLECKECKIEKELSEFYKHPEWKFGVLGRCKECIKAWRSTERELVMARKIDSNRYYNNEDRKEYIYKSCSERRKRKWYWAIHLMTERAIKKRWIRPTVCPICNIAHKRIEAHHIDYVYWNKFIFACSICHKRIHSWKIDTNNCELIILPVKNYNYERIKI